MESGILKIVHKDDSVVILSTIKEQKSNWESVTRRKSIIRKKMNKKDFVKYCKKTLSWFKSEGKIISRKLNKEKNILLFRYEK